MLRKTISLAALAALTLAPLSGASAQGLPPEDGGFEIETEETREPESFLENLSQYIGATAGATTGSSNAVEKSLQAMNIAVDIPMPRGFKAAFSVDVGNYENIYTLELSESDQFQVSDCRQTYASSGFPSSEPSEPAFPTEPTPGSPQSAYDQYNSDLEQYEIDRQAYDSYNNCERFYDENDWLANDKEITVDDSFSEMNEAFIQWEPTSFMTLQAGRQPIVLGQFEAFSPLMFLTPMKSTGTKTRTAKADLSYAQDGFNVSLFPTSNIEVSYLQAGKMRIDPSTAQRLKQFADEDAGELKFVNDGDPNAFVEEIEEHDLSVARIVYYGDRLTLGLTSVEGADTTMDLIRDAEIVPDDGGYALGNDKGMRFPEMSATAFELSYRLGSKWTFAMEYTEQETETQFSELPNEYSYNQADWMTQYARVVSELDGRSYIDFNVTMASAGLIYKGDRWLANLQVAQRTEEGATATEDDLYNKLNYEFIDTNQTEEMDDTLPILNVARLLGAEKQGYVGAGFGVFAQSFGFGLTGGWRYFEKLEIGAFMGMALEVTGADTVEQQGYESPEGESYVNFGVNYLF